LKKTSGKLQKEEIRLYRKLQTLLHKKNKEILARFKKDGLPSSDIDRKILVQPLTEAIEDYANIVIDNTADAVERGVRRSVDELNKLKFGEKSIKAKLDYGFIKDFSIAIFDKIKKHIFEASENTMNRLIGDVMDNLSQSYKEGYGYNKAAEMLKDVFVNMETYELEMVARTEIAGQENLGMHEGNKELGVEYEKWRTARDADVRDSHQELEGQIVRVGDRFSNGLEYPGDRSGPIEEWINCRCTLMPYILPEGMIAPELPYFYEKDLVKEQLPGDKPISGSIDTREEPLFDNDEDRENYIKDVFEKSGESISDDEVKQILKGLEQYTAGGSNYKTFRKYSELGEKKFKEYLESTMGTASDIRIAREVAYAKMRTEPIERYLKIAPKAPQKDIFRGIQLYEYEVEKLIQKGKIWQESSFSSYSNIKDIAKERGNVIFQSINNKGVSIAGFSRYADEAEVLMPKNVEFLIKSIKRVGRGVNQKIFVTIEEIVK